MANSVVVSYGVKAPAGLQRHPNYCHSLPPLNLKPFSLTLQNPVSLKYNSLTTLLHRRLSSQTQAALESDVPHPLHEVLPHSKLFVLWDGYTFAHLLAVNKSMLAQLMLSLPADKIECFYLKERERENPRTVSGSAISRSLILNLKEKKIRLVIQGFLFGGYGLLGIDRLPNRCTLGWLGFHFSKRFNFSYLYLF
jgi:hypothetical protein